MAGLSLIPSIIMALGSAYIIFFLILFLKGRRHENLFQGLDEKEYPLKEIFFVGYEFLDMIHYNYRTERVGELRKKLGILYEEKYAEYYVRVVQAQRTTSAMFLLGLAFVFYGVLQEYVILVVFAVMAGVAYYYYGNVVSKRIDERSQELLSDFSQVVSELALLTNAGMILREAWATVAKKGTTPLYQEMQRAVREVENGMAERDAYYTFGIRCVIPEIKKFTSTILQGMTKGNAELGYMLQDQSKEIWARKKQSVDQLAEAASTKLMLPMCVMFLGIIILIIIPIFSNIGV